MTILKNKFAMGGGIIVAVLAALYLFIVQIAADNPEIIAIAVNEYCTVDADARQQLRDAVNALTGEQGNSVLITCSE
jgi:hypoxanthine phosphoribosyltransferase